MNRIARRSGALTILVLLLVAGFAFFLAEYAINAADWVMRAGSPHVYAEENIKTGANARNANIPVIILFFISFSPKR